MNFLVPQEQTKWLLTICTSLTNRQTKQGGTPHTCTSMNGQNTHNVKIWRRGHIDRNSGH